MKAINLSYCKGRLKEVKGSAIFKTKLQLSRSKISKLINRELPFSP